MSERSAAPVPPNYRETDASGECCGTCVMRNAATGLCWGYGNVLVETDHVCDSWSPETGARGGQRMDTQERAVLSSAEQNDLPDSAFAYIEPGGKKDAEGKTTPRKLRHFPIHDKAHVQNALSRAPQSPFGEKAMPAIKAAAKKFGIDMQSNSADPAAEERDDPTSEDWSVGYGLKNLKGDLARVKADQLADPDNKTDPDDAAVMSAIEEAEAAIDKAISAQGVDAKREPAPARSGNPATPKRAFSSLVERSPAQPMELAIRMGGEGEDPNIAHFDGYAYTINERYGVSDWLGVYEERIGPGASSKTLREQIVPLLINHKDIPIASTGSKTSELADDGKGLRNRALLDRRQGVTNDICIALERGDVSKMSFSFRAVQEDWNDTYDDRLVRELQLYDTSIVTYPANPHTSAELVDSFRSALGREGRSLWLADSELSVRGVLPLLEARSAVLDDGSRTGVAWADDESDLLEKALRALVHADEVLCRSHGPHGRARTFHVATSLLDLRAGKALSAKNQALLQSAADALASADRQHAKVAKNHATASDALNTVLDAGAGDDGKGSNQGADNGSPITPQDGAGPRSAALRLKRAREAEVRALRGR